MSWWDERVSTIEQFRGWVRGIDDPSRKYVRDYMIGKKYKEVLDVAAGLCEDFDGFKRDSSDVKYSAIDFTDKFVEHNAKRGIDIVKSECSHLPFVDSSFDVVYLRHVVEHLSYYEETVNEMIRVAKKEVVVTFFLPTTQKREDEIRIVDSLNHNFYSQPKFRKFLKSNEKVLSFHFENFGIDEEILFIVLK